MDYAFSVLGSIVTALVDLYHSPFFSFIKFLIGMYTAILLVDIVLLLMQRPLGMNIKETRLGINVPKELIRSKYRAKLRAKWGAIRNRLATGEEAQFKLAIMEADDLINDLLRRMDFPGGNMGERLENANPGQLENLEDLKRAHTVRNRIIHDAELTLTKGEAEEVLAVYEEFLRYYQIVD